MFGKIIFAILICLTRLFIILKRIIFTILVGVFLWIIILGILTPPIYVIWGLISAIDYLINGELYFSEKAPDYLTKKIIDVGNYLNEESLLRGLH